MALARGLESLGARGIRLKWPNDVLLAAAGDFAKLAGILVELASDRQGTQAVIGIGVNLQAPRDDLPQPATGLDQALMPLPDRHLVLAAILRELVRVLEAFAVDGFSGLDFSAGSGAGVFSTSAQAAKSSATRNAHVRRIFTLGPPAAVDASQSLADSDAPR